MAIEQHSKTFEYTGSETVFQAPETGTYHIKALGASGGVGNKYNTSYGSVAGKGASIESDVELQKGDVLRICVGQQGTGNTGSSRDGASGGGGGGTFVFQEITSVENSNYDISKGSQALRVLLVAAGGGGTGDESYKGAKVDGKDGIGTAYKSPSNYTAYSTTTKAGTSSSSTSSVMGVSQYISYDLKGAYYTRNSSTGQGGYGGGGAADDSQSYGGGWSGSSYAAYSWSYNTSATGQDGANEGNGSCEITWETVVPDPEPEPEPEPPPPPVDPNERYPVEVEMLDITSVTLAPNPVFVGASVLISVGAEITNKTLYPEWYYSGELYAGE